MLVSMAVALTFVLGPVLQVLAIRKLGTGDYATFVFALAIGNVANALAASVQPVVAVQVGAGKRGEFLPTGRMAAAGLVLVVGTLAAAALGQSTGMVVAGLAIAQLPLHAVLGASIGALQGARRFAAVSVTSVAFAPLRLLGALAAVALGHEGVTAFVAALPAALAVSLVVAGLLGAFRAISWSKAAAPRTLLFTYLSWVALAFLVNADAIYARLALPDVEADRYGVAFNLGRLAVFAIAPIATVLLPAAQGSSPSERWQRTIAAAGLTLALGAGLMATVGAFPAQVSDLLTGDGGAGYAALVRVHIIVGTLAALVTLLATLAFAVGVRPPIGVVGGAAVLPAVVAILSDSPVTLATAQAVAVGFVAAAMLRAAWAGRRAPETAALH